MSDFVTIATYDNYVAASFNKQKLDNEGILNYLADEHSLTMQWMLGNALGGIKLRVPQEMMDDALRILNEKAPELPAEPDDEYKAGEIKCPSCGSTNVRAEKYSRSIFAWTWMLLGFPVPVPAEKVHKCFNCGHEWRA